MRGWPPPLRGPGAFFNYTLTPGIGLTERLGFYIDVFGDISLSGDAGVAHYLDGGFTWAPRENLQYEVSVGVVLSDAAADYFVTAGLSIRLPE